MIKCPKCGKENRDNSRFCSKCGTSLAAPSFLDYYTLLDIAPDAPPDKVKQALHDAAAGPSPLTPEQLAEAIDTLTDPRRRAEYDERRKLQLAEQQWKKADLASNDYYKRLGVSRFARRREIQVAFASLSSLVKTNRISRGGLRRLEEAHACLADPARRRAYDQSLDAASSPDDVPVPHEFNYYDYLALDRNATETQIRKADEALRGPLTIKAKTGDKTAEETLRQLNQIIQTLTDGEKRKQYDADVTHDVFRFQTPGRPTPTLRAARFAVIESIIYGPDSDGLCAFGGLWPDDLSQQT
jgi:DnaJ-class molecular chaperone